MFDSKFRSPTSSITGHKEEKHFCCYCLLHFSEQKFLEKHEKLCKKHKPQAIDLPVPGKNILKFEKYEHAFRVPFVIYADFECLLKPCTESDKNTKQIAEHVHSSFAYIVVGPNGALIKEPVVYRGENVVQTVSYD